ncbi:hypothetical protein FK515_29010, partial [Klebsiella pneumoniae]|nr:hypothetical protein [Klebsiella pneumoniae]
MALGIGPLLTALSIGQLVLGVGYLLDITAPDRVQHEEQQSWEMTWLLKEMEQSSQEPGELAQQGVLKLAQQG